MTNPEFDPYRKWLGIHPRDQPPNHYRLLGLDLFEDDLDVIEVHVNKQMAYLHGCATGEYGEYAERLLNEIAAARLCLIGTESKRAYDAELRSKLSAKSSKNELVDRSRRRKQLRRPNQRRQVTAVVVEEVEDSRRGLSPRRSVIRNRRSRKRSTTRVWVLFGGGLMLVLSVIGFLLSGSKSSPSVGDSTDDGTSLASSEAEEVDSSASSTRGEVPERQSSKSDEASEADSRAVEKSPTTPLEPKDLLRTNSIGMQFRLLPTGSFMMGKGSKTRKVFVSTPIEMGVHEVTQEQYTRVMGRNPSGFRNSQHPVNNLSWDDAVEFCSRLSDLPDERQAGISYRLPTVVEWTYACRAGAETMSSTGYLSEYAWFKSSSYGRVHPVGQKKPNDWGLFDMQGNVYEWCQSPVGNNSRAIRGGSFNSRAYECEPETPAGDSKSNRRTGVGFRVVRVVPNGTSSDSSDGWRKVFNGQNLDGWRGDTDHWSIENSELVGQTDGGLWRSQFLILDEAQGDFELSCQFRIMGGKGDSGIRIRSTDWGTDGVKGHRVDLSYHDFSWLGGLSGVFDERVGSTITETEQRSLRQSVDQTGWNSLSITADDRLITIRINDVTTFSGRASGIPENGLIALQVSGGTAMEVRFRDIRIR